MKVSNKEIAAVFKAAIPFLAKTSAHLKSSKYDDYICIAVGRTNLSSISKIAARNIIMRRIYPHSTLKIWLYHIGGIIYDDLKPVAVQKHRHTWLKLLIKEFGG